MNAQKHCLARHLHFAHRRCFSARQEYYYGRQRRGNARGDVQRVAF